MGQRKQPAPLRKIVRREKQDGKGVVVMVCGHAVFGEPASRASRFFPCPPCGAIVEQYRRSLQTAARKSRR